MEIILFKTALGIYLLSALLYAASLWGERVFLARLAAGLMFTAWVVHTLSFAALLFVAGGAPPIGIHAALSLFAWVMAAVYLAFQVRTKTQVLGAFVSPVICLFMVVASIGLGGPVNAPPMLRGSLVTVHVIFSVAGEALFAIASCAGLMYLIQDRLLRQKQAGGLSRLLPSLGDLDRINHICLLWGVPLLTLGGLVGSVWARIVWGSHWQWDPKQVWTLLAWGCYAFLLHQRLAIGWRGRTAARWSLALFVALVLLLIVGLPFFGTLHRFV
ncbi:MAG: cytochrome c biogenesis protein CcsA [Deltaproteobacteria bacterium]|nr:cytochrome c biogenesis protein CcsA [Deltaproteobacteria bacterium]